MLFSSLALYVAAAAVSWGCSRRRWKRERREELSICVCQVQPGAGQVLPVVARHGMQVEHRDGYEHLPQTMSNINNIMCILPLTLMVKKLRLAAR
jgi:hypothetical protein